MKSKVLLFLLYFLTIGLVHSNESSCPFCQPMENQEIFRKTYWRVVADYKPVTQGHLLIIPLAHRLTRHELSFEEHAELYEIEKKIHCMIQERFGKNFEDFQYEKNGPTLQSVNHFHIHVLPIDSEKLASGWQKFLFASRILLTPPSKISDEKLEEERQSYLLAFERCADGH